MKTAPTVYTATAGMGFTPRRDIKCFDGGSGLFTRSVMEAKLYKVLAHQVLRTSEVTIWLDSNIGLKVDAREIVAQFLGDADIGMFRHPYRRTVWEEFATLKIDKRFAIPYLQTQMAKQEAVYRTEGLPADAPLYECNFLIRRNSLRVARLMDAWWSELCVWQWRDQVSLPYVLWKYGEGVTVRAAEGVNIRNHPLFHYTNQHY